MAKAIFTLASLAADSTANTFQVPADKPYTVYQNITGVSTDDTLDTTVEESPDGGTTWYPIAVFTQVTAAGKQVKQVAAGHAPMQRLNLDITAAADPDIDGTITVTW